MAIIISSEEINLVTWLIWFKHRAKQQNGGSVRMLLATLCASLLGNLLTCEGTVRVDQDF